MRKEYVFSEGCGLARLIHTYVEPTEERKARMQENSRRENAVSAYVISTYSSSSNDSYKTLNSYFQLEFVRRFLQIWFKGVCWCGNYFLNSPYFTKSAYYKEYFVIVGRLDCLDLLNAQLMVASPFYLLCLRVRESKLQFCSAWI